MANTNLQKAKNKKNDEFYTQLADVEEELEHYKGYFLGKTVYCNCDDPAWSAFWKYFHLNFGKLGLKKLMSTHYHESLPVYKMEYEGGNDKNTKAGVVTPLSGNGDFRSKECLDLLDKCDIVVTNPPFSLFREYIRMLMEHGKKFLVIGNMNAITYKEIFPLIKENTLWLGCRSFNRDMYFNVPDDYKKYLLNNKKEGSAYKIINGVVMGRLASACWFTNLDHKKRHEKMKLFKQYTPEAFPKYDNYDAINIGKVQNIPDDYGGIMGVPVTFLDKYNPEQFEIVTFRRDINGRLLIFTREREKEFNRIFASLTDSMKDGYDCGAWDLRKQEKQVCVQDMTEDGESFMEYICSCPDLVRQALADSKEEPVEKFFRFDTDGVHKLLLGSKEPFKRLLIRRR